MIGVSYITIGNTISNHVPRMSVVLAYIHRMRLTWIPYQDNNKVDTIYNFVCDCGSKVFGIYYKIVFVERLEVIKI